MSSWRKLAALLAAAMLAVGFAACGDDDDDDTAVGTDDIEETAEHGDEPAGGDTHMEEGNPCAPDAPDDALPPSEELDADATPVTITATEYAFAGTEPLTEGGAFGITLVNAGAEMHEFNLVRLAEDEDRPLEEIIASEEEPELTEIGHGFACPGGETTFNVDVTEPGRYVAVCFIPVGSTPAVTEEPQGPPHAEQGMVFEFEIA